MSILRTAACAKVLAEINPPVVSRKSWEFFLRFLEIPRKTFNTKQAQEELRVLSQTHGWAHSQDAAGNTLISVPATQGYERVPSICLQSHCDMVCVANEGLGHDFLKDPIVPRVEGEWVKATGTTLGSDNGAGLGISLGLLADAELKHGPLEVLVTIDEEVGLVGANAMKGGWLKSKVLLNIDSEKENAICISCAGGFSNEMVATVVREPSMEPGSQRLAVKVTGLAGGHSGCDIEKYRSSALQVMGRLLYHALDDGIPVKLVSLTGGVARNAIPKICSAEVTSTNPQKLKEFLNEEFGVIKSEIFRRDPDAILEISDAGASASENPMDAASTKKLAAFLLTAPHGVVRMSHSVADLVETSYATTMVRTEANKVIFNGMGRSSSNSHRRATYRMLRALCEGFGIECGDIESDYPGWAPNPDSAFVKVLTSAHEETLGIKPEVYAIHAGLECGIIADRYPGMDCASVGPQIEDAHSPQERLHIKSFDRTFTLVRRAVELFAEQNR